MPSSGRVVRAFAFGTKDCASNGVSTENLSLSTQQVRARFKDG